MTNEELAADLWRHIDGWRQNNGRIWSRCESWHVLNDHERAVWRALAEKVQQLHASSALNPKENLPCQIASI